MSVISTGDFAKALGPQVPKWFGMGYNQYPALYEKVFTVKSSDHSTEEDVLISGTSLMLATSEGEATPYDRMKQGYVKQYGHTDYRLGLIVTKNMIRDGKGLKIAEMKSKALGMAYMQTKNTVAFNVLNNGFDSNFVGGDGVELFGAHPTAGGTMTNELAVAADLSEASLEQADLEIGNIRDDRGLRINLKSQKLVLPRALKFEGHRILNSTGRVNTPDNDTNALKDLGMYPGGIIVVDYLTDPDAWFILTDADMQGLTMYMRQELELSDDTNFDTDNAKFKAHARFSVGWTDFRHAFGSAGA